LTQRGIIGLSRETAYYFRMSKALGAISFFGIFGFMPVIRRQPLFRRFLFSAAPAWYLYNWTQQYGEGLRWGKVYYAYQKMLVIMGEHDHVLI
jgi:hypothetical protein